jgi:Domain of unknown function (DUF4037)
VPDFLPGLTLSRRFYEDAVEPLLRAGFGRLPHTAARVGSGSEVLGFDTPRSADHEWGPRLQLFLGPADAARHAAGIGELLSERLPRTFLGWPTHFESDDGRIGAMAVTDGPVRHRVEVADFGSWLRGRLGFDPRGPVSEGDWLATPTQALAEVTGGAVFHDGLGGLGPVRERLAWYPDRLWRHVLACQWRRISQEEAFVGRCGEVGDELGSAVVAARLVRDLMRLCLLMARRYPPYSKWLGSAFARLPGAPALTPVLTAALAATAWRDRERHLGDAYEAVAARHNELGLTAPIDPATRPFHDRPFRVLRADRFADALREADLPWTGAVDQVVDNTDALTDHALRVTAWRATPS